jgi:hypothetical protein
MFPAPAATRRIKISASAKTAASRPAPQRRHAAGGFAEVTAITAIIALLLTVQLVAVAKYPETFAAPFGATAP